MAKRATKKMMDDAIFMNNSVEFSYFNRLRTLAENLIGWEKLPIDILSTWVEKKLTRENRMALYYDQYLGWMMLPFSENGDINELGYPRGVICHGENGFASPPLRVRGLWNTQLGPFAENDCLIVWDTSDHYPIMPNLVLFAIQLCALQRTIDTNISAQKRPLTIICDDNQVQTALIAYEKITENVPVIIGTKKFDLENIKIVKTDAPMIAPQLSTLQSQKWAEALNFLGYEANAMTKAERQVTDEIVSNLGYVEIQRMNRLTPRLEFAEAARFYCGLEFKPVFSTGFYSGWHGQDNNKEERNDESLYNGTSLDNSGISRL